MSVALTVAGVTYQYPTLGNEQWGTEATDWAVAVSAVLTGLVVPGDLGPTVLVSIANGQASAANIASLAFDSATIRAAQVQYYVYRTYNSGTQEVIESGTLFLHYKDIANTWDIVQVGNGVTDSGVVFSVTTGGQVQYTSSTLSPATGYSGLCKYRATVLPKT